MKRSARPPAPNPCKRSRFQVIPARWSTLTFVLLLSGLMTGLVAAISTIRNLGINADFAIRWADAFVSSWPVTFPVALVVIPVVRRIVAAIVRPDPSNQR